MRLQFLPADAHGRIDAVMSQRLWDHSPDFVNENPDAYLVPISFFQDFTFNPELLNLRGKKYIIADTLETYGQWPDGKSHIFGISDTPAFSGNPEWQKFSNFVRENPPILQFVREIYRDDVSRFIQPLEWPCALPAWQMEPKENFDGRPFEVFFNYGVSSCYRPMLHGDILKNSCKEGYEVINHLDHIDAKIHQAGRKWIAVHQPHTHRVHIDQLALRQAQSKLAVSLKGAGWKCFRSTEVVHSCPAIHSPNLAWAFDWVHGHNCIHLEPENELQGLLSALRGEFGDLHQMYVEAQNTLDRYRPNRYYNEHIKCCIEAVL